MKCTLKKISDDTGYSISSVSRVLAGSPRIGSETKRIILDSARRNGYQVSSGYVAIIIANYSFPKYVGFMLEQLCKELIFLDYHPVIIQDQELDVIEMMPFSGAISVMALNGLERLWGKRHSIPLVCINTAPQHLDGIYTVYSNDAAGIRTALDYLIKNGHRKIGRVGMDETFFKAKNWNGYARDEAFRAVMAEHRLPDDLFAAYDASNFIDSLDLLLSKGITALLVPNEKFELQILHALRLLRCRIPEDISLITLSFPGDAENVDPMITSLEQDFKALSRHSCVLFEKLLRGEQICSDIVVDYNFRIRFSTGPCKTASD